MEETETEERPHKDSCSKRLKDLFGELAKLAPRVGSVVVGRDSSSFGVAQEFYDFQLKTCRNMSWYRAFEDSKGGNTLRRFRFAEDLFSK